MDVEARLFPHTPVVFFVLVAASVVLAITTPFGRNESSRNATFS